MSTQPLSQGAIAPTQEAIATVIFLSTDPDFDRVLTLADNTLEHQYYDHLAEQDTEMRQAGMQFPS